MADHISASDRSRVMRAIKSKDTKPELFVRRMAHRLGFRFRLHVRNLPGTPDLVFPRHRKIIEVRGCFWHMHACGRTGLPKTHRAFWKKKLTRNAERDRLNAAKLRRAGWKVLVVWECQIDDTPRVAARVARFLESKPLIE